MIPRRATLKLIYNIDPNLDPNTSSLGVILNGIAVATLPPGPASAQNDGFRTVYVSIPDALLVRSNILTFEFIGSGVMQREEQARAHVFVRISIGSILEVNGDRIAWKNDLRQLPLPIFDSDLQSTTTIPFVFLSQPSPKTLEAAGVVASWLGLLASTKPVRFSVSIGQIPAGNAIVFSDNPSLLPGSLQLPTGAGRLLALRTNPSDADGTVLVIAGEDDEQLLMVARTLSLIMSATAATPAEGLWLSGDTARVPDLAMPATRRRGDAPRWLPTDRATPLTSCRNQDALQTDGSSPIPIYFHVPPDLHYGEKQNLSMHVHYRYNALQAAPGSALRVVVNGMLVNEIQLPPGTGLSEGQRAILVPVAYIRPFGNTILFNFDFIPANRQVPQNQAAETLKGEILCNSSLDLQDLGLWTEMPNLELFANAGFPFTQLADLSKTTVVLPVVPSAQEIALYLHLMSHFGAQTGYPALLVTVAGPNAVIDRARDYLILGTIANQPAFNSLDALLPVMLNSRGIQVKQAQGYSSWVSSAEAIVSRRWHQLLGYTWDLERISNVVGVPDALVEEIQSPSSPDRSIVLIALKQDASADDFAGVFLDRSQSRDITGSVSLLHASRFDSYELEGGTYHVGIISWYSMMRIWLTQYFLLLLLVVTAFSFLLASWTRGWLARRAHERLILAEKANTED